MEGIGFPSEPCHYYLYGFVDLTASEITPCKLIVKMELDKIHEKEFVNCEIFCPYWWAGSAWVLEPVCPGSSLSFPNFYLCDVGKVIF